MMYCGQACSFAVALHAEGITTGLGRQGRLREPWLAGELALLSAAATR